MDQLKPMIAEMIKLVESGKDVVNGQLPDLCRQIIRLYLWGNVIEIPLLISLMIIGGLGIRKLFQKASADEWRELPWLSLTIPIFILEIVIGVFACDCVQTFLKAVLAPKLLILEVLKSFV